MTALAERRTQLGMDEQKPPTEKRGRGRPRKKREVNMIAMLRKNRGCTYTMTASVNTSDEADATIEMLKKTFGEPATEYPLLDTFRLDLQVKMEVTDIIVNPVSSPMHDPTKPEVKLHSGQMTMHRYASHDCVWWATETQNILIRGTSGLKMNIPCDTEDEKRERLLFVFELNARNARLGIPPPVGLEESGKRACPVCGKSFTPNRSDQVYDTPKCADTAGARRRRSLSGSNDKDDL